MHLAGYGPLPPDDLCHHIARTRGRVRHAGAGDGHGAHISITGSAVLEGGAVSRHRHCGCAHMTSYRIKRHRQRRHGANHFALIPFIDMMTILVVFLLAHTADVDILPNTKNISIPQSISDRKPSAAVVVMVTRDSVFVDGVLVGSLNEVIANQGPFFAPLKTALMAQNDRSIRNAQQTDIAKREVTIMGDKSTPYSVLKKIMLTCSEAEYGKVSFAVVERERAAT